MAIRSEPHCGDLVHEDVRGRQLVQGRVLCLFPEEINRDGEWEANLAPEDRVARIVDLNQGRATSKICVAVSDPACTPPEQCREPDPPSDCESILPDECREPDVLADLQ